MEGGCFACPEQTSISRADDVSTSHLLTFLEGTCTQPHTRKLISAFIRYQSWRPMMFVVISLITGTEIVIFITCITVVKVACTGTMYDRLVINPDSLLASGVNTPSLSLMYPQIMLNICDTFSIFTNMIIISILFVHTVWSNHIKL